MAEETQLHEASEGLKKRKNMHKKGKKGNKKAKVFQGSGEKVKIDRKMKKIIRKRVRDYNSDEEEEEDEDPAPAINHKREKPYVQHEQYDGKSSDDDDADQRNSREDIEVSDDEDGEIQPGITKLTEGCKAFRMAFKKITKTSVSNDVLGPVLSAHKKLVAEKLAAEEEERKVKGDAKKEKHQVGEKGHVKPLNYLDVHEKFLIGVATKGVVKLFNAVNKAQSSQKGLNPSRSKDAKELQKRRKQAFFTELGKAPSGSSGAQVRTGQDEEGPSWAPLRDNYMLTNPKMKDWDKIAEATAANDFVRQEDSSSDDE